jgi:hypothetical protein
MDPKSYYRFVLANATESLANASTEEERNAIKLYFLEEAASVSQNSWDVKEFRTIANILTQ